MACFDLNDCCSDVPDDCCSGSIILLGSNGIICDSKDNVIVQAIIIHKEVKRDVSICVHS